MVTTASLWFGAIRSQSDVILPCAMYLIQGRSARVNGIRSMRSAWASISLIIAWPGYRPTFRRHESPSWLLAPTGSPKSERLCDVTRVHRRCKLAHILNASCSRAVAKEWESKACSQVPAPFWITARRRAMSGSNSTSSRSSS